MTCLFVNDFTLQKVLNDVSMVQDEQRLFDATQRLRAVRLTGGDMPEVLLNQYDFRCTTRKLR